MPTSETRSDRRPSWTPIRSGSRTARLSLACLPLALSAACARGGSDDGVRCEVAIEANHHFFGLVARPRFAEFPTVSSETGTLDGMLALENDCRYRLSDRSGAQISTSEYALQENGSFAILVPGNTTSVFRGAYGREGDTGHVFVTDRVGSAIGLYWGSRVLPGPADRSAYVGSWRVFELHSVFATAGTTPNPNAVGLAFAGELELAADGSFTGSGVESESGAIAIRGQADKFVALTDGRTSIEILHDPSNKPNYERAFVAGGTPDVLFGVDGNFGGADTAAGLFAMLRRRTEPYTAADLAGVYDVGLFTLFLRPDASGSDAAIGRLELVADGNFVLEAQSNTGADFVYRGTFAATEDGGLTFTVSVTDETWRGAFDDGYNTVVLLDPFRETRSNGQIELNIGVALRKQRSSGT